MKQPVAIAVSGGVDSLVSAFLLKQQGIPLFGIHFITGFEKTGPLLKDWIKAEGQDSDSQGNAFKAMGDQLGIPVKTLDMREAFKKRVVDYFISEYAKGRTPNPCMVCNPEVKFGALLNEARSLGATRLATGHYAKITRDEKGRFHLFRGADPGKDQSYFLAFLNQARLSSAMFPLEDLTKAEVIEIARQQGLNPVFTRESQDICFIQDGSYRDFLFQQPGFDSLPGPIVDLLGKTLGHHQGLHRYTIGQRRGINLPAQNPYYVIRLIPNENKLVVGQKQDLPVSECRVAKINWIMEKPVSGMDVHTRVRYRHEAVPSKVMLTGDDSGTVFFREPQAAVTPGQAAVFYAHDEVLGGGWIEG
jgi:tRNA-specific 2-thiouridylase